MSKQQRNTSGGGRSKAPARSKTKQTSPPSLSGRYSRSEGPGSGPKRKHPNAPPKKK
jgi:hypothetical protein